MSKQSFALPVPRPAARRLRGLAWTAALLVGGRASAATLGVVVSGVEPGGGRVLVSLCEGGLEPPDCPLGKAADPAQGTVRFSFPGVAPGLYAVAAFQDANGNGALDRTRNGLPLEPYGFSNGTGRASVPRFERAAFALRGDAEVAIRLTSVATRR